jgi:methyl-accepting chemotaxis protein
MAVLVQVDARTLEALERIALAQMVMSAVMVILGVLALGGAVIVLLELRSARRLMRGLLVTVEALRPRLAPFMDRVQDVTTDVSTMTGTMRRKLDEVIRTAESVSRAVERGTVATEERLQRFTAVLDIVQTEAEELLLDAAATAHGMQETARVLRERPGRTGAGRPAAQHRNVEPEEGGT